MYAEIYTAVSFLSGFLYNKLPRRKVNLFSAQLANDLVERFTPTWKTNEPHKGAELRKLNVKARGVVDTLISVTALNVGLNLEEVLQQFPDELTVWVDPGEVTFRLGERGQATVIYSAADPNSVTLNRMLTQNLTSNADGTGLRVNFAPALWNNAHPLTSTPLNALNQYFEYQPLLHQISQTSNVFGNGSIAATNNEHCMPAFELTSPNDVQFTVGSFAMTRFGTTKVKNMPTALNRLRQKQRSRGVAEGHFRSIAVAPASHSSTPPPGISCHFFSNSHQSVPTPSTPNLIQRPFSAIPFNLAPGSSPRDKFLSSFSTNELYTNNSSAGGNRPGLPSGGPFSSSYFDHSMFGGTTGEADGSLLGSAKLYKTPLSGGHSADSSSSPNSSSTPGSSNNNREFGGAAVSNHSSGYSGGFSDPTSSPSSTSDIATTLFGLPPIRQQNSWNLGF